VVYWCNSYTIVHFSLDIIEWFKYKLKKVFKLYLILIHPPLSINTTFQRDMDIAFIDEKDRFVVIYLDDITVFSTSDEENLHHLKKTFEKCRRYGISLNSKKSHFAMEEGKILGHIVSPEGIKIDPERVKAIQQIDIPRNKKSIQTFIGKINFLRRFIPNFAEIMKYITDMLKKDV
jgi:hypothetical protein